MADVDTMYLYWPLDLLYSISLVSLVAIAVNVTFIVVFLYTERELGVE